MYLPFGDGAGETIRRRPLPQCDVHTLLRLSAGLFYAQGVKANALFFDKRPASERSWICDLRTNKRFTLKEKPLRREDLDDFLRSYNPANRHEVTESERFWAFAYDDFFKRGKANLDLFWLKDENLEDSANLPAPDVLAAETVENFGVALAQFAFIGCDLATKA